MKLKLALITVLLVPTLVIRSYEETGVVKYECHEGHQITVTQRQQLAGAPPTYSDAISAEIITQEPEQRSRPDIAFQPGKILVTQPEYIAMTEENCMKHFGKSLKQVEKERRMFYKGPMPALRIMGDRCEFVYPAVQLDDEVDVVKIESARKVSWCARIFGCFLSRR